MLALKPSELLELKAVLSRHVPNAAILAFGSRVIDEGSVSKVKLFADLDLAITEPTLPPSDMFLLRHALTESNLPFRVDICNWKDLPSAWKPGLKTVQIQ